jgi:hypothetical protein
LHRPGQPCAVCHSADGTSEPYVFAGTVYRDPEATVPVADVAILLVDSKRNTFTAKTNCVGNFYVKPSEFSPTSPTWVSVQSTGFPFEMSSPMHREASCEKCHFDPAGPASAGHIYVANDKSMYAGIPTRPCGPQDGVTR